MNAPDWLPGRLQSYWLTQVRIVIPPLAIFASRI